MRRGQNVRECDFPSGQKLGPSPTSAGGCSWRGLNIVSSLSGSTTKHAGERNQEIMYCTLRGRTRSTKKSVSGSVQLKVFSVGNYVEDYNQAYVVWLQRVVSCTFSIIGESCHKYHFCRDKTVRVRLGLGLVFFFFLRKT